MKEEKDIQDFAEKIFVKLKENNFFTTDALEFIAHLIYLLECEVLKNSSKEISEQLELLKKQNPKSVITVTRVFLNRIDFIVSQLRKSEEES